MPRKSAKQIVETEIKTEAVESAVKEEATSTHYYRCNVTLDNGKACNCFAFN
jgi:hypothetical protein